jgi:hypothetical protein
LAYIEDRSFAFLALAYDHNALHGQLRELAIHCAHGGLVGGGLIAPAAQPSCGGRRRLGHPDDLKGECVV